MIQSTMSSSANAPANAPLSAPALVMSDSEEEEPAILVRLLCTIMKGDFDRTHKNLAVVKSALAAAAGVGAAGGGADFRGAELSCVKSTATRVGFVVRPLTSEGAEALVGWCAVGQGMSCVLKELMFEEGTNAGPENVEVDCCVFECKGDRGGDVDAGEYRELVAAVACLPCASKLGLGAYTGATVVLSYHLADLVHLQLMAPSQGHKHDYRLMAHAVMHGGAAGSVGRGLAEQAEAMGYTARYVCVDDPSSLCHGRAFQPKVLAGKADSFHTEGAMFRVEFSPKETTGAPPAFFLDGDLAWPREGSVKKGADSAHTFETVPLPATGVVSFSDCMTVTRVWGADGEALWAVGPAGVDGLSLRPGLTARAEPGLPRGGRRKQVDAAQKGRCNYAVRDAVKRACPGYSIACTHFQVQLAKRLGRTKAPELAGAAARACTDLESDFCRRSACQGEGGCGAVHFPCNLVAVLRLKAEQESLAAVAGKAVVVLAREFTPGAQRGASADAKGGGKARRAERGSPRATAGGRKVGGGRPDGARGRGQGGAVGGRGGAGWRGPERDEPDDVVMEEGEGGGGVDRVAAARALSRSLYTRVKQRLRTLVEQGWKHLCWEEGAAVCTLLFRVVRGEPRASSCENAVFLQFVGDALGEVRGCPAGAQREVGLLEGEAIFVSVARPLGKGEKSYDGKRQRRTNLGGASESEFEETPGGETARDAEWDGVMRHLAETMHSSITQGITPTDVAAAVKASHGDTPPLSEAEGEAAAKRVWRSLKALEREGKATTHEARGDVEERVALKAAAYGDCFSAGSLSGGEGLAAFEAVDVDKE